MSEEKAGFRWPGGNLDARFLLEPGSDWLFVTPARLLINDQWSTWVDRIARGQTTADTVRE